MTAHAPRTTLVPLALPAHRRVQRPRRSQFRLALTVLVVATTFLCLTGPRDIQSGATAVCTFGEPAGTTCGEALVELGYP